jgi:acyl carrier protein
MENINEKVKAIVAEKLGVDIEMVVDSANFQADLGADSLDIVELVMNFEKEFGIEIPDDDAGDNIVTVADAVRYIEKKVQEK